jgi:hypothetical protein
MNTSRTNPVRTRDASSLVGAAVGVLLMTVLYTWDLPSVNWLGWLLQFLA